jgi:hypothetical protein
MILLLFLGSSWYLNKVSINDTIREITYDIPCNAWLSSKSNDQKTMRDFQVSSMVSRKKHSNLDGMKTILSQFC